MSKSLRRRIINQLAGGDKEKFDILMKEYARTQLRDLKLLVQK